MVHGTFVLVTDSRQFWHVSHKIFLYPSCEKNQPRHVAAAEGHADICQLLVENGAHINRSDRWGSSAVDDAHKHRHFHVLRYLRDHGGTSGSSSQAANFITAAAEGDMAEISAWLDL